MNASTSTSANLAAKRSIGAILVNYSITRYGIISLCPSNERAPMNLALYSLPST